MRQWDAVRAKLKPLFEKAGITSCELGLPGCWHDNALGFAHSLKRRFIVTPEQEQEVCLLCSPCHDKIEVQEHGAMAAAVRMTIAARKVPVEKICEKS